MQITKYKVIIVLPAYNEGQAIAKVISGIINAGFNQIIVVNDGSKDNTGSIAKKAGAHVVSHIINRGVGAARFTGNKAALQLGADIIVQMDADGQHDPSDIYKIIKPIIDHRADITIGSRFLSDNKIPSSRRILNWIGNLATMIFFGIWVSDSQTGFKAFSQVAAQKLNTKKFL
ncbi:MAG: glycosyltransferase family 2 protein [Patescibacteria group bacterium]|nr:glycosyltransferase family 2 protein [Patescibacteria group bacterium]